MGTGRRNPTRQKMANPVGDMWRILLGFEALGF
jgi:hypothetical protein